MPLRGEAVYLFAFDVGQEVLADVAGPRFPRRGGPADPRRRKTVPSDGTLYRPLTVDAVVEPTVVNGSPVSFATHVYDAGVIAVTARVPFTAARPDDLRRLHAPHTAGGEPLAAVAGRVCERVRAALGAALRGPVATQGPEGYTVFTFADLGGETDAGRWVDGHRAEVGGLLADLNGANLSESHLADTLRLRCSLERTDAVVIDWDAAVAVDLAGGVGEVIDVLEMANLLLLEWKVLDAVLDRHLNTAYDQFARRPGVFSFGWGRVLRELRQLRTDTARLTDEVSNIGKFIGDWYLARVYQAARERFHLDGWRASLDHRLSQLDRVYGAMRADANDRRMLWLEVLIVLLIAVELVLNLFARG
jgi:hypothetical protein